MIIRKHFRACFKENVSDQMKKTAVAKDAAVCRAAVTDHKCLTVALYGHENMLFLYFEALTEDLKPELLFPELSKCLELWPQKDGKVPWAYMYHIYYHAVPKSEQMWARSGKKIRRGRIACLKEEKLFSYVYYHKMIVDEGLLEGDMYQSIALHENILFSYFEEPKIFTHIKSNDDRQSEAIKAWMAVDPESHFDHKLSGEDNFLFIDEIFSTGREDN